MCASTRFKGQPQTHRGLASALGDRDKVTDQRQSRFSQNQSASSVFTIGECTIIKTSITDCDTSWELLLCFIYLCSNRCKRKKQIERIAEEIAFPIWEGCEVSRFFRRGC